MVLQGVSSTGPVFFSLIQRGDLNFFRLTEGLQAISKPFNSITNHYNLFQPNIRVFSLTLRLGGQEDDQIFCASRANSEGG